ncbi:glycosyltransferase family 4 protein [Methanohalophilus halophilus]|nr:glycosyltransferase family 4 protein [Methanohalophilus halophilus]
MKKRNMLFIAHSYSNFQKESIDSVAKYFNKCSVLIESNPIAEISNYINIPYLKQFNLNYKIDLSGSPVNVNVQTTPMLYAPLDSQYKKLGEKHLKKVEQKISETNIDFDIIHSHFTWSSGYVGAKLKEKYNVPFVVTAHGFDIYLLPFKDEEWKEKIEYVLNSADHIITVSKSNLRCIEKLNVRSPVSQIPNGFNSNLFYPRDPIKCRKYLNLPLDKKIIVSVGNLVEVKGHKYLIQSIKSMVESRSDIQCYIVGWGRLDKKLRKLIDKLGLRNHVKLVGGKPHNEIPYWMNACDLFVLPSLRESFGVVQIEALACGKPVVATHNGGSEEIIVSEDYGILVEPGNYDDLSKKIDLALNKKWDTKSILNYSNKFKWDIVAAEVHQIYEDVETKLTKGDYKLLQ